MGSTSGRSSRDRSRDRRTAGSARSRPTTRRSRARSEESIGALADAVAAPERRRASVSRTPPKRSAFSWLTSVDPVRAAVIGIVVVFLALTLAVPVRTYLSQRSEFHELQESKAQLQAEVAELQKKVAQQNDPAFIEAEARQRLQYVKRGEKQVIIIEPSREQQEAAEAAERERAANPWYENMWDAVATPPEGK